MSFVEFLEEIIYAFEIDEDKVDKALLELLTGLALLWYWNTKDFIMYYRSFHQYFELHFLPPGYHRSLHKEVHVQSQWEYGSFREFKIAYDPLSLLW